MTSFGGITRASAALGAASYGLDVTGQNIANANTDGYVRERSNQVALAPSGGIPALYATPSAQPGGVGTTGTMRMNDPIVDARARNENAKSSYLGAGVETASGIESAFPEPGPNGVSAALDKFFSAWSTLATNPNSANSAAIRQGVIAAGQAAVAAIQTSGASLTTTASNLTAELGATVTEAGNAATALGSLNVAISSAFITGQSTAGLADQRDQLLLTLSKDLGVATTLNPDGTATVTAGGQSLVTGNTVSALAVNGANQVTVGGTAIAMNTGKAGGLVQGINVTVPAYQAQLDSVASTLITTVNAVHTAGYDATGTAGGAFFSGTNAATIAVAITTPSQLAAATVQTPGGNNDGNNAVALANLQNSSTGAASAYATLVANIGSASQLASRQQSIQNAVTASAVATQTSISGVNYDEEVSNMLMYQRAYQASARVLSTVDSLLDQLINHTGV